MEIFNFIFSLIGRALGLLFKVEIDDNISLGIFILSALFVGFIIKKLFNVFDDDIDDRFKAYHFQRRENYKREKNILKKGGKN